MDGPKETCPLTEIAPTFSVIVVEFLASIVKFSMAVSFVSPCVVSNCVIFALSSTYALTVVSTRWDRAVPEKETVPLPSNPIAVMLSKFCSPSAFRLISLTAICSPPIYA